MIVRIFTEATPDDQRGGDIVAGVSGIHSLEDAQRGGRLLGDEVNAEYTKAYGSGSNASPETFGKDLCQAMSVLISKMRGGGLSDDLITAYTKAFYGALSQEISERVEREWAKTKNETIDGVTHITFDS